jgi:hypothetical protein
MVITSECEITLQTRRASKLPFSDGLAAKRLFGGVIVRVKGLEVGLTVACEKLIWGFLNHEIKSIRVSVSPPNLESKADYLPWVFTPTHNTPAAQNAAIVGGMVSAATEFGNVKQILRTLLTHLGCRPTVNGKQEDNGFFKFVL